jgi:uncharacterized membrane protein
VAGEPESLDQNEPFEARDRRHAYDRMIMLSDGVFAIAITLLALDVRAPTKWPAGVGGLLAMMAPVLSAFVLSFLVISLYWLLHRRYVAMLMRVDWIAMVLNLAFLGLIALLPAATRLAESTNGITSALELYAALVVAIGAGLALFWGYATFLGRLVYPEIGARARWAYFLVPLIAPPLTLGATIPTRVPSGLVPIVLLAMFVVGGLLLQRLVHPPDRAGAVSDAPPES